MYHLINCWHYEPVPLSVLPNSTLIFQLPFHLQLHVIATIYNNIAIVVVNFIIPNFKWYFMLNASQNFTFRFDQHSYKTLMWCDADWTNWLNWMNWTNTNYNLNSVLYLHMSMCQIYMHTCLFFTVKKQQHGGYSVKLELTARVWIQLSLFLSPPLSPSVKKGCPVFLPKQGD